MVRNNANTDPVTLNLSGAVHLLVGLSIVIQHFRWGSFLEGVVTLIGISAVLKGAALITIPELTLKSPKTNKRSLRSGRSPIALDNHQLLLIAPDFDKL